MLFYYLCTVGEKLHREAYPQGAQSKDADVYKWVTLHSGSPAVCQREHPADHRWRPDEGGDEERVVRSYAVLQWDKEGFDFAKTKPEVAERFDSRWGPSLVALRGPRGSAIPPGRLGERVELPVEHRQLVHRVAGVARAAEAQTKRKLDDVDVRLRPNESHRRGARARKLDERFDRSAEVWPHERPPQAPSLLRLDVAGREDLSLHGVGLGPWIAIVF